MRRLRAASSCACCRHVRAVLPWATPCMPWPQPRCELRAEGSCVTLMRRGCGTGPLCSQPKPSRLQKRTSTSIRPDAVVPFLGWLLHLAGTGGVLGVPGHESGAHGRAAWHGRPRQARKRARRSAAWSCTSARRWRRCARARWSWPAAPCALSTSACGARRRPRRPGCATRACRWVRQPRARGDAANDRGGSRWCGAAACTYPGRPVCGLAQTTALRRQTMRRLLCGASPSASSGRRLCGLSSCLRVVSFGGCMRLRSPGRVRRSSEMHPANASALARTQMRPGSRLWAPTCARRAGRATCLPLATWRPR